MSPSINSFRITRANVFFGSLCYLHINQVLENTVVGHTLHT